MYLLTSIFWKTNMLHATLTAGERRLTTIRMKRWMKMLVSAYSSIDLVVFHDIDVCRI